MKILRTMMMLAMVAVIAIGMSTSANAAFKLRLTDVDTNTTLTIEDNDINDQSPLLGKINFDNEDAGMPTFGEWVVTVTTGLSKPILGDPLSRVCMDLNSVEVNSASPATIILELTDTDFVLLSAPKIHIKSDLAVQISPSTQGTFVAKKYYDAANQEFGGQLLYTFGTINPPGAFLSDNANVPYSPAFSMTEVVTIVHNRPGITSFDYYNCATPVPEPGTLMLLGSGLLGIAGYARVRFGSKKKKAY